MKQKVKKYLAVCMAFFMTVAAICPKVYAGDDSLEMFYILDSNKKVYSAIGLSGYLGSIQDEAGRTICIVDKNSVCYVIASDNLNGYLHVTLGAFSPTDEPGEYTYADGWYYTQLLADNQASIGYGVIRYEDYPECQIGAGKYTSFNFGDNILKNPAFGGEEEMNLKADGTLYKVTVSVCDYDGNELFYVPFLFMIQDAPDESASALPTASKILVDGEEISFDAYNINGNNYFKLRDLAKVLSGTEKQFEVSWDNEARAINLISGKAYTPVGGEMTPGDGTEKVAQLTDASIYLNGELIKLTAYNIGGNNYFKLRDVGEVFDFDVSWDNESKTITVDTSKSYTPD